MTARMVLLHGDTLPPPEPGWAGVERARRATSLSRQTAACRWWRAWRGRAELLHTSSGWGLGELAARSVLASCDRDVPSAAYVGAATRHCPSPAVAGRSCYFRNHFGLSHLYCHSSRVLASLVTHFLPVKLDSLVFSRQVNRNTSSQAQLPSCTTFPRRSGWSRPLVDTRAWLLAPPPLAGLAGLVFTCKFDCKLGHRRSAARAPCIVLRPAVTATCTIVPRGIGWSRRKSTRCQQRKQ